MITVTVQLAAFAPLLLQLIVTVPGVTAVILPWLSTVATAVLLLVNVMSFTLSTFEPFTYGVSFAVFSTSKLLIDVLSNVIASVVFGFEHADAGILL